MRQRQKQALLQSHFPAVVAGHRTETWLRRVESCAGLAASDKKKLRAAAHSVSRAAGMAGGAVTPIHRHTLCTLIHRSHPPLTHSLGCNRRSEQQAKSGQQWPTETRRPAADPRDALAVCCSQRCQRAVNRARR